MASNKPKVLTKDAFLKSTDREVEYVDLSPRLDGGLYVRGMTALERDTWETLGLDKSGKPRSELMKGFRAKTLLIGVCNPDGTKFFDDPARDVMRINNLPAEVVDKLYKGILRLSGVGEKEQREVEELVDTPTDASFSEPA